MRMAVNFDGGSGLYHTVFWPGVSDDSFAHTFEFRHVTVAIAALSAETAP